MATHYNNDAAFDCAFADDAFLPLPPTTHWEQSALLADGKILMASVDTDVGAFLLTRHLGSGALDDTFGEHGVQRIASEVASSVTSLSLELESDGRLFLQGTLSDRFTARHGTWLLRVLPSTAARVHLGVGAFLSTSRSPLASEMLVRVRAAGSAWWSQAGQ